MILLRYYKLFKINATGNIDPKNLVNITIHLQTKCTTISDYRTESLLFAPLACALIVFFSFLIKRKRKCLKICDGRPGKILK